MAKKNETAVEAAAEVIEEGETVVPLIAYRSGLTPELRNGKLILRTAYGATVYAQARRMVGTGVFAEIPAGHVGLIMPSAELRDNYGVVCQGLRMPGEEGEIVLTLINCGMRDCDLRERQPVAEMIVLPWRPL